MEKRRIILARHGQDEDNANKILNGRRDTPLTSTGVLQAYELSKCIRQSGLNIGCVVSSPLKRSFETGRICATELSVPHVILSSLIERGHGILEGRPYSDIPILAKKYREAWGVTYIEEVEGGETYPDLCIRAKQVFVEISQVASEMGYHGDILITSHGAISKALEIVHKGLTWENLFDTPSFQNCEFRVLE